MIDRRRQQISAFDLDHTLFSNNSGFGFGLYLYRQRLYSLSHLLAIFFVYVLVYCGFFSLSRLHQLGFKYLFKGHSKPQVQEWLENFLNEDFEKKLYPPAIEKLKKAQAEGQLTVILSNSPDFIVETIAKRLGVPLWRSTHYAVDDQQRFSHIISIMHGNDKAHALEEIAASHNIPKAAIKAYSDSHLDLPFLLAAGSAVGVKPDRKLKAFCKKNQWPII